MFSIGDLLEGLTDGFDQDRHDGRGRDAHHHEDEDDDRRGARVRLQAPGCVRCGTSNPPGARFCLDCGAPLGTETQCSGCGALLTPAARFCAACGVRV